MNHNIYGFAPPLPRHDTHRSDPEIHVSMYFPRLLVVGACTTNSAVEDDFGNSVSHMIESQKAHPAVSANPQKDPVDGTDIYRASQVLEEYRNDVSKPEEVSQDIIFNIPGYC